MRSMKMGQATFLGEALDSKPPCRDAWQGSGSFGLSGLSGLFRLSGTAEGKAKTDCEAGRRGERKLGPRV
jgi:hypothetical protein